MNRKVLVTSIGFFILGFVIASIYHTYQIQNYKNYSDKLITNLTEAIKIDEALIDVNGKAYLEAENCSTNPTTCNLNESKLKLQTLNEEKNQLLQEKNRIKDNL